MSGAAPGTAESGNLFSTVRDENQSSRGAVLRCPGLARMYITLHVSPSTPSFQTRIAATPAQAVSLTVVPLQHLSAPHFPPSTLSGRSCRLHCYLCYLSCRCCRCSLPFSSFSGKPYHSRTNLSCSLALLRFFSRSLARSSRSENHSSRAASCSACVARAAMHAFIARCSGRHLKGAVNVRP